MRIWFDRLRLLRSSPTSPTRRWLVRRGNRWLWRLLLSSTYREAPPFRHKAILIILQSITPGMTRIMHRAGVGVTHGAGDGLSEFPSDLADAGTAGSAAAFSVQSSDASALVTLASSIRGSDAPALCMRVLVAVSVTAWAGASTAAGTARPAHVRHPSCRFSRLQRSIKAKPGPAAGSTPTSDRAVSRRKGCARRATGNCPYLRTVEHRKPRFCATSGGQVKVHSHIGNGTVTSARSA